MIAGDNLELLDWFLVLGVGPASQQFPLDSAASALTRVSKVTGKHKIGHIVNWCSLGFQIDHRAHLSKGPSDLKQKCTQLPTPFLGTVFHALSLGVIHFILNVRSRNHFFMVKIRKQPIRNFKSKGF